MLLTEEVEITLNFNTIKYYENLGYFIPRYLYKKDNGMHVKRGTQIKVRVKDLSKGSKVEVEVLCDQCKIKIMKKGYGNYLKNHKINNMDICGECNNKNFNNNVFKKYGVRTMVELDWVKKIVKESNSGKNSNWWKGGITSENHRIRISPEYKQWRTAVFERDDYTCQVCGKRGSNIQAHHLESFADNLDLRFVVENGVTICEFHHNSYIENSFHNIYGTLHNKKEQFEEYKQFILNQNNKIQDIKEVV